MAGKGIRKAVSRKVRRAVSKGKKLVRKAMRDPLVREYVAKQKKLAKSTLRKAIRRVEKKL